jgi:hypothetical protein
MDSGGSTLNLASEGGRNSPGKKAIPWQEGRARDCQMASSANRHFALHPGQWRPSDETRHIDDHRASLRAMSPQACAVSSAADEA